MSSTHNIDFFFLLRMFLSSFCCGKLCKFLLKYLLVKENPFFLIETISNNYIIPVTNKMLHIGVHTELGNPTNSSDPPETEPQPLELTNPTVGGGSPTIEPDTFGSISGFPPQKLEPPDPTIKSTKSGDIQMFSNKFTNIGNIFAFPTKSYLKSTRSSKISLRSSPDSMDPDKYRPDLDQSVKILANLKPTGINPKPNGLGPDDPTIIIGQFWFCFSPTRNIWIRSWSSTNLTRFDSCTPLGLHMISAAFFFL